MRFGKSIRIYLKDGTVTGIKFGEIMNQTIQAISCPRSRIGELSNYEKSTRPGIYFLFGIDDDTLNMKAYIGEGENVYDRLKTHVAKKDFWSEAILFVSKDTNLTKGHIRYLESRMIEIATETKRYIIDNVNQSKLSPLPMADRDAMEEFGQSVKLLLGTFGHKLLEDIAPISTNIGVDIDLKTENKDLQIITTKSNLELFLTSKNLSASAIQTDEGIVVLEGSEASKTNTTKLQVGYKELKEKLIKDKTIKLIGEKYIFQKNYLFPTASPAAAIIVGYNINGRIQWKDENGKTLKEIEEQKN